MTEYLLYSERFTGPVSTDVKPDGTPITEIQTVNGWQPFWREYESTLVFRPEMQVIDAVAPYLDPPRTNGERGLKVFKLYARHDAGYSKQFIIPAGLDTLLVEARGHCWFSQRDDAHKSEYKDDGVWQTIHDGDDGMTLEVGIDTTGGTDPASQSVAWQAAHFYDAFGVVSQEVADPGALVTVFIRSSADYPFKHADAYWAGVEVIGFSDDAQPTVCRGLPREQYARVVNVIAGDATPERFLDIAEIVWDRGRQTVTGSYDDAGIGDLDDRTAVLWDIPESEFGIFRGWYAEHYPGTKVRFAGTDPVPPVEPPEPEPEEPPTGEGPQYTLPSDNLIGLHMMAGKAMWTEYVAQARPTIHKAVIQLGQCAEAKRAFPEILTVYRRFTPDDGSFVYYPGGPKAGALAWLDGYSRDFEAQAQSEGITVERVLQDVDIIEEVNEMIGTHDPDIGPSVEFNIAFADAVRERYGNLVNAGMLTIPVGNPGENEVALLLPAARKAYEGGHFLAPHPYWSGNREHSWLTEYWRELAGRWTVWDEVFRANGVYPRYYGGEMGIVYADPDWWNLNSGRGWKSCGDFTRYIGELQEFNRNCLAWNAAHGNRYVGNTIFCYTDSTQWGDFDFEPGDLMELAEAMK